MNVKNKFNHSQIVYLIHDPEQHERMITQIIITPNGLMYMLSCGDEQSEHYEIEIGEDKKVI